jgi:hypothetical protein
MAERPTILEITAAQGIIVRLAGFEQLAAAYLFGQPLPTADPGQLGAAAPATRLEQRWPPGRFKRTAPWPRVRIRPI